MKMQHTYNEHKSKDAVRNIKNASKIAAQNNRNQVCICSDLQQVIYIPKSNVDSIFYKRRYAVYNLTFYDVASRGASEVSTALFKTLQKYDARGVHFADLFADGCGGQNRNSIVASFLLNIICQMEHLKQINLRFFNTNHGQCEGDSAHSAISYAVKKAGKLFVPSQLLPVFRFARHSKPYEVYSLIRIS